MVEKSREYQSSLILYSKNISYLFTTPTFQIIRRFSFSGYIIDDFCNVTNSMYKTCLIFFNTRNLPIPIELQRKYRIRDYIKEQEELEKLEKALQPANIRANLPDISP
jgi:hypothetical protein